MGTRRSYPSNKNKNPNVYGGEVKGGDVGFLYDGENRHRRRNK